VVVRSVPSPVCQVKPVAVAVMSTVNPRMSSVKVCVVGPSVKKMTGSPTRALPGGCCLVGSWGSGSVWK
jgi:hypothetical protein